MSTTTAPTVEAEKAAAAPCCQFAAGPTAAHHDRLLGMEWDFPVAAALIEQAITFGEVEHDPSLIHPDDWAEMVAVHHWRDRQAVYDFVRMLTDDVVGPKPEELRRERAATPPVCTPPGPRAVPTVDNTPEPGDDRTAARAAAVLTEPEAIREARDALNSCAALFEVGTLAVERALADLANVEPAPPGPTPADAATITAMAAPVAQQAADLAHTLAAGMAEIRTGVDAMWGRARTMFPEGDAGEKAFDRWADRDPAFGALSSLTALLCDLAELGLTVADVDAEAAAHLARVAP